MRRIANSQGGPGGCDWKGQTGQGAICSSQALDEGGREVNRESLPIQDDHENNQRIARPDGNRLASASWATNQLTWV